jgi:hypothetical protein
MAAGSIAYCVLENHTLLAYIDYMSDKIAFAGTVVRTEADGFAIIEFDIPVGPSANNFGLISSSTGTATVPFFDLKPGVHVSGTAEAGESDLAAIKTVRVDIGS